MRSSKNTSSSIRDKSTERKKLDFTAVMGPVKRESQASSSRHSRFQPSDAVSTVNFENMSIAGSSSSQKSGSKFGSALSHFSSGSKSNLSTSGISSASSTHSAETDYSFQSAPANMSRSKDRESIRRKNLCKDSAFDELVKQAAGGSSRGTNSNLPLTISGKVISASEANARHILGNKKESSTTRRLATTQKMKGAFKCPEATGSTMNFNPLSRRKSVANTFSPIERVDINIQDEKNTSLASSAAGIASEIGELSASILAFTEDNSFSTLTSKAKGSSSNSETLKTGTLSATTTASKVAASNTAKSQSSSSETTITKSAQVTVTSESATASKIASNTKSSLTSEIVKSPITVANQQSEVIVEKTLLEGSVAFQPPGAVPPPPPPPPAATIEIANNRSFSNDSVAKHQIVDAVDIKSASCTEEDMLAAKSALKKVERQSSAKEDKHTSLLDSIKGYKIENLRKSTRLSKSKSLSHSSSNSGGLMGQLMNRISNVTKFLSKPSKNDPLMAKVLEMDKEIEKIESQIKSSCNESDARNMREKLANLKMQAKRIDSVSFDKLDAFFFEMVYELKSAPIAKDEDSEWTDGGEREEDSKDIDCLVAFAMYDFKSFLKLMLERSGPGYMNMSKRNNYMRGFDGVLMKYGHQSLYEDADDMDLIVDLSDDVTRTISDVAADKEYKAILSLVSNKNEGARSQATEEIFRSNLTSEEIERASTILNSLRNDQEKFKAQFEKLRVQNASKEEIARCNEDIRHVGEKIRNAYDTLEKAKEMEFRQRSDDFKKEKKTIRLQYFDEFSFPRNNDVKEKFLGFACKLDIRHSLMKRRSALESGEEYENDEPDTKMEFDYEYSLSEGESLNSR